MSDAIEPLTEELKRTLRLAGAVEPGLDVEERVFAKLQASIAAGVPLAAPATGGLLGAKGAAVLAVAMLASGTGLGVLLGRTALAPAPGAPTVVERIVRVEVPVAPVVVEPVPMPVIEPAGPAKRKPVATAPVPTVPGPDQALAKERELIDTARSALLHGDAQGAVAALRAHQSAFANGRLDEERESLWVQALVLAGDLAGARSRAAQFHRAYPHSLLGATVDAALSPP